MGEIVTGSTPRTDDPANWNGDILWATPNDMGKLAGFTIYNTERKISEKGFKSCSTKLLPVGSVLLTTRAPIGHIAINTKPVGVENFQPLHKDNRYQKIIPKSIGSIVRGFKISVIKWCDQQNREYFAWQRNYYDHIIRNEEELNRIRGYIINNPLQWQFDRENPKCIQNQSYNTNWEFLEGVIYGKSK